MLHPLLIISLLEVIPRMCATTLRTRECRFTCLYRVREEVSQLERFNEIGVPYEALVGDAEISDESLLDFLQLCVSFGKRTVCAEYGCGGLHRALHSVAEGGGRRGA